MIIWAIFNILKTTAIPYRASTGPEQGFPCVVFPHREKPVFIAGFPVDENRFFPVGNTTQGKPCFHYRDGFAVYVLALKLFHPVMSAHSYHDRWSIGRPDRFGAVEKVLVFFWPIKNSQDGSDI